MRRVRIVVRGAVQGVGFRLSAHWEAKRLGLHGFVQNLPSGEVEIVAEGKADAVERMVAWAEHGPPMAQVENIVVDYSDPTGEFAGFSVNH